MSTTARCGGSSIIDHKGDLLSYEHRYTRCPGCEDCRPTQYDSTQYNKPPLGRPIPPADTGQDRDTEPALATSGNIAPPLSPVEAMARRMASFTKDGRGDWTAAAAMLRALDRECDRLRATLAECMEVTGDDERDGMQAARDLGIVYTLTRLALATDTRGVDRG